MAYAPHDVRGDQGSESHCRYMYFAAMAVSPFVLGLLLKTGFYRTDWRPALGFSGGAVAGAAAALAMGTSFAHWVVALSLVLAAAVVPWAARYNTEEAARAREAERKRRLREERMERTRVRRRERRRERGQRGDLCQLA